MEIQQVSVNYQTILSSLAFVISILSYLSARSSIKYTKSLAKRDLTKKHIEQHNSPLMRAKFRWVTKNLASYVADNKMPPNCGLTLLNSGKIVKLRIGMSEVSNISAGDLCKDLLNFFNTVSQDIRLESVDVEDIFEEMMQDMIAAWDFLGPVLKHDHVRYYRFMRIKYSVGSLVSAIRNTNNSRHAAIEVKGKWGFKRLMWSFRFR